MNPSDYLEQAISALLAQDEKIINLFYSHTYDKAPIKSFHQTHHKIKQWVENLTIIRDEIIAETFDTEPLKQNEHNIFYIQRNDMVGIAKGEKTDAGFRVLRGSCISKNISSNMYKTVKRLRQVCLKYIDENNRLTTDLDFDNAGQAARFVIGKQVNGLAEWRTVEGLSLKAFLNDHALTRNLTQPDYCRQCKNDEFTKRKPSCLVIFGETHLVKYWRDVLICTCEVLYAKIPQVVREFDKNKKLNKKRPNFSWHKEAIKQRPAQLSFKMWVELNQSARTTMDLCYKMLIVCGYSSKDIIVTTQ